jgi:hypothetical protein
MDWNLVVITFLLVYSITVSLLLLRKNKKN